VSRLLNDLCYSNSVQSLVSNDVLRRESVSISGRIHGNSGLLLNYGHFLIVELNEVIDNQVVAALEKLDSAD
jgi:hypothetical protein